MVGRTLPSQSLTLAPRRPTLTAISATFARGADVRAFRRRILLPYSVKRNRTFARRALRTLGARAFASEFLTLAQNQRTLQAGGRTFAPGASVRRSRPRKLLPHSVERNQTFDQGSAASRNSTKTPRGGEFRVPPAPPTKGSVWCGCCVLCVRVLFVVVLSWIDSGGPPAPLRFSKNFGHGDRSVGKTPTRAAFIKTPP